MAVSLLLYRVKTDDNSATTAHGPDCQTPKNGSDFRCILSETAENNHGWLFGCTTSICALTGIAAKNNNPPVTFQVTCCQVYSPLNLPILCRASISTVFFFYCNRKYSALLSLIFSQNCIR